MFTTDPFYHKTIRNIVVGFGTLFNNIKIIRRESNDQPQRVLTVPLSYGAKSKYIERIQSDYDHTLKQVLPRITFEMMSPIYDPERKVSTLNKHMKREKRNAYKYMYSRVPYIFPFQLGIFTKLFDDSLQIVEQVLPYFTPEFTITIEDIPELDLKTDIPIALTAVSHEDLYEGGFEDRRTVTWTLDFEVKGYLYKPERATTVVNRVITNAYLEQFDLDASPDIYTRTIYEVASSSSSSSSSAGWDEFFKSSSSSSVSSVSSSSSSSSDSSSSVSSSSSVTETSSSSSGSLFSSSSSLSSSSSSSSSESSTSESSMTNSTSSASVVTSSSSSNSSSSSSSSSAT